MKIGHEWKKRSSHLKSLVGNASIELQELKSMSRDFQRFGTMNPDSFLEELGKEAIDFNSCEITLLKYFPSKTVLSLLAKVNDELQKASSCGSF